MVLGVLGPPGLGLDDCFFLYFLRAAPVLWRVFEAALVWGSRPG